MPGNKNLGTPRPKNLKNTVGRLIGYLKPYRGRMILDDSTSAVDTATDAQIRAGLKKLDKNMTTIIIAQRISSVEGCDKIVVLDDGKINAVGTHEQLLKTCKIYQEVYHSQQKGTVEGGEN